MARKPRKVSVTGYYHVMQRGVNLFDIFEDDIDRHQYLVLLTETAAQENIGIHAWCLMSNHTHLLLRGNLCDLSNMMRRLGSRYASYFNHRHGRIGHLFEGRFESVCIESDSQYLTVIRYIHHNPVDHEEGALGGKYPWSSYAEYASGKASVSLIGLALKMLGGIGGFIQFHNQGIPADERHLDIDTLGRLGDEEARMRANAALENAGFGVRVGNIGRLARRSRDAAIALVKQVVGCSLRQMQRLTAVAYSAIRTAVLSSEGNRGSVKVSANETPLSERNVHQSTDKASGKALNWDVVSSRAELRQSLKSTPIVTLDLAPRNSPRPST